MAAESQDQGGARLKKVLGLKDLYFISVGGVIGSAWLFGALYASSDAGPASVLSWMIGGAMVLLVALAWAELGGMLPAAGAVVKTSHEAYGSFGGFYFGWAYFLSVVTIPPVETVAIITYAAAYAPGLTSGGSLSAEGYAVGLAVMGGLFLLNYFGVAAFAKANNVMTLWKILVPSATIAVALTFLYPPNFTSFGGFAPDGLVPVFTSLGSAGIVFAFSGFRQALDYSGEAKDPGRDVPRAVIFSVLTAVAVYTLLQVAFVGGIRWQASGVSPGDWGALVTSSTYSNGPFYRLMFSLGVFPLAALLLVDAVVSPFGTASIYAGSSARDMLAMAGGGHLPKWLGEVHAGSGVPRAALLVSLALGVLFLFLLPSWGPLASVVTAATVFSQMAGAPILAAFRRAAPGLARPFRLPAYRVLAPAAFLSSSLIVYWTKWPYTGYAFLAVLSGVVIYAVGRARGAYPEKDVRRGAWAVGYSACMVVLSYLGEFGRDVVPFPLDTLAVLAVSAVFYRWGVASGGKETAAR